MSTVVASLSGEATQGATTDPQGSPMPQEPPMPVPNTDREFVLAAGMTPEEADCWAHAAKVAGAFFQLPELHPMDRQEIAQAVHIIQNKLLGRPTYRRYLALAKAAEKAKTQPSQEPQNNPKP